jgi:predicted metal-dependent peptidase
MIALMEQMPFYAELLMRSRIIEIKRDEPCRYKNWQQTMGVNISGDLLYDEEFVQSLSDEELNFVMLHESKHKSNLHVIRGAQRNQKKWGLAIDIVVDHQLTYVDIPAVRGLQAKAPKNRLIADRFGNMELNINGNVMRLTGIDRKSAEEVYADLPDMPEDGQGTSLGRGIDSHNRETGEGIDFNDLDEHEQEQLEESQKDEIVEAATKCAKRGKLPADVQRLLDQVLKGKVDWRRYLWKHIVAEIPNDVAWRRPSRRFVSQGIIMPGIIKENLDVVVFIDLSGSIDEEQKKEFVAETVGISELLPSVNITLVTHDSKVCAVTEITHANKQKILRASYRGGGGTDHRPCFEWVKEHKRNARVLVMMTDGKTVWPEHAPAGKEILVVLNDRSVPEDKVPFGKVIKMQPKVRR